MMRTHDTHRTYYERTYVRTDLRTHGLPTREILALSIAHDARGLR